MQSSSSYLEFVMVEGVLRDLGKRLRERRLAAGMSQEEVADKAGLHRTYIGSVERGERNITVMSLHRLARAVGTTASELLAGVDR